MPKSKRFFAVSPIRRPAGSILEDLGNLAPMATDHGPLTRDSVISPFRRLAPSPIHAQFRSVFQ